MYQKVYKNFLTTYPPRKLSGRSIVQKGKMKLREQEHF